jgi:hypothetical protein
MGQINLIHLLSSYGLKSILPLMSLAEYGGSVPKQRPTTPIMHNTHSVHVNKAQSYFKTNFDR